MKKRTMLLATVFAASSLLGCTAFAESADEVLQKYIEASTAAPASTSHLTASGSVNLSVAGQAMEISGDADLTIRQSKDPIAVSITGNAKGNLMGEEMPVEIGMYVITAEDGAMDTYYGVNGSWQVVHVDAGEAGSVDVNKFVESLTGSLTDLPITYTLSDGTVVSESGVNCHMLSSDIKWSDVPGILRWAFDKTKELAGDSISDEQVDEVISTVESLDTFLSGLNVHTECLIDQETYLPVSEHVDLSGSDLSTINSLLGSLAGSYLGGDDAEGMDLSLEIGDIRFDTTYDYSDTTAVTVPDDVKANATPLDTSAVEENLESLAG